MFIHYKGFFVPMIVSTCPANQITPAPFLIFLHLVKKQMHRWKIFTLKRQPTYPSINHNPFHSAASNFGTKPPPKIRHNRPIFRPLSPKNRRLRSTYLPHKTSKSREYQTKSPLFQTWHPSCNQQKGKNIQKLKKEEDNHEGSSSYELQRKIGNQGGGNAEAGSR